MHDNKVTDRAAAATDVAEFIYSHLEAAHFHVNFVTVREVVGVIIRHRTAVDAIIDASVTEDNGPQ